MWCFCFCFLVDGEHRDLHGLTHSFPTRRASDLLTRMSSLPPSASTARGTSPSTSAGSDRLHGRTTASPPISAATAFSASSRVPDSATPAPCAASPLALADPMPPLAPLPSAVNPVRPTPLNSPSPPLPLRPSK